MPFKPVNNDIKIIFGPLIDDTDFKSREEAITFDSAGMEIDIILEKNDGTVITTATTASSAENYEWTHINQGYYSLSLPISGGSYYNNDSEGILYGIGYVTGVLPFRSPSYDIIPIEIYDSIVNGTDNLKVDSIAISNSTIAADTLESNISNLNTDMSTLALESTLLTTSADIQEVLSDTNEIQSKLPIGIISDFDNITETVQISGTKNILDDLNDISTTEVNTEIVDAINIDNYSEPSQGALPVSTSLVTKVNYIYKFLRNKISSSGTEVNVYNDAGDTIDHKATTTETSAVVIRDEFVSGP